MRFSKKMCPKRLAHCLLYTQSMVVTAEMGPRLFTFPFQWTEVPPGTSSACGPRADTPVTWPPGCPRPRVSLRVSWNKYQGG